MNNNTYHVLSKKSNCEHTYRYFKLLGLLVPINCFTKHSKALAEYWRVMGHPYIDKYVISVDTKGDIYIIIVTKTIINYNNEESCGDKKLDINISLLKY